MPYPEYVDYKFAIARGETGSTITALHAYCATMSDTAGFVLAPKNIYAMTTPTVNTANSQYMRVTSDSANDATAGTGMVEMNIAGVDEDGNYQSETILMFGQTPKTTASKYVAINRMWANTCGSGLINAGTVYIGGNADSVAAGVPKATSTTYNLMAPGDGTSSMLRYCVPNSTTAYIVRVNTGQDHSTDNTTFKGMQKTNGNPKQLLAYARGNRAMDFDMPIRLPAKAYFWVEGMGVAASATNADIVVEMAIFNEVDV